MKKLLPFVLVLMTLSAFTQERPPQKEIPKTQKEKKSILKTPGNLIIKSSHLRLAGIGISIGTSTLYAARAFEKLSDDNRNTILIASGIASLSLYIAGELTLVKAGELLNKERITISTASEGIGLAINF